MPIRAQTADGSPDAAQSTRLAPAPLAQRQPRAGTIDVRMPDGTVVRGVPAGTTRAQLDAKLAEFDAKASAKRTSPAPRNADSSASAPTRPRVSSSTRPPAAAARPPRPQEQGWGSALLEGAENIPNSAWNTVKGIAGAVRHPFETFGHLDDVAMGGVGAAFRAAGFEGKPVTRAIAARDSRQREAFESTVDSYKDRYGSASGLKRAISTDPVGVSLDAAAVFGGAAGLARDVPEVAGRAAFGAKLDGLRGASRMASDRAPVTGAFGRAAQAARGSALTEAVTKATSPGNAGPNARAWGPRQRAILARHRLDAERAAAALEKHQRVVGNLPVDQQRAVVNAIESASAVPLGGAKKVRPAEFRKAETAAPHSGEHRLFTISSPGRPTPTTTWDLTKARRAIAEHLQTQGALDKHWNDALKYPGGDATIGPVKITHAPVADGFDPLRARMQAHDPMGFTDLPEAARPAAREIRSVAQSYRKRIEQVMSEGGNQGPKFVEDYYARMWKQEPREVVAAMSKAGSGRNLRARSIPTYQDGLNAGLTPVHENPIDAMTAYVDNMSRYLAVHDLQNGMRAAGIAKWHPEHSVPDGWTKLDGPNTVRDAQPLTKDVDGLPVLTGQVGRPVLAAPSDAARLYNNYLDPGMQGPVYKALNTASTATSQLALGLSGFHGALTAGKAFGSEIARAADQFTRGKPLEALKTFAAAPIAPATRAYAGFRMGRRMLSGDDAMGELDHLYVHAGGRLSSDAIYRSTIHPNVFKSFARGTLRRDISEAVKRTYRGSLGEKFAGTIETAGQVADSLNAPIFQYWVPALKRGVFESEMAESLRKNPGWSDGERQAEARRVLDSIDDRFGEMVRDNNFWKATHEQVLRLLLLSPSWNVGNVRMASKAIGGLPRAAETLLKRKGIEPGVAALGGVLASSLLMNGIANYFYTGEAPRGQDWLQFRTGGTTAGGYPERAMIPSSAKDVYAFAYDFPNNLTDEAENKANPFLRTLVELGRNKDYFDRPIIRPGDAPDTERSDDVEGSRGEQLWDYLKTKGPLTLQGNPNPDTGIGTAGTLMGIRPSGLKYTNPERDMRNRERYASREWEAKVRADAKRKAKELP